MSSPVQNPTVTLKTTHRSGHPIIFQRMVERPKQRLAGGTIVDVIDKTGAWVGRGFYNPSSKITLRLLTRDQNEVIDREFFRRKIAAAVELRRGTLALDTVTDAYRLVHAEGDGLSGLIIDRFHDTIVIEVFSLGMYQLRDLIIDTLKESFPSSKFVLSAEESIERQEGFQIKRQSEPRTVTITEHGVRFLVEPGGKHKTGFFSDQRDNRLFLSSLVKGKRVLDLCCNTGGFAVYAKSKGGAKEVVGVDLDEDALALAEKNSKLNRAGVKFVHVDLFKWLREEFRKGERFDVVILDPSKQAQSREEIIPALKKYVDMNKLALHSVAPGGIFVSCSCTGLVSEADFLESIRRAASLAERTVQIFKVSGAGPDHPFLASVPEGRYLKAVWAKVY